MKKERFNYYEEFEKNSNYSLECAKTLEEVLKQFKKSDLRANIAKVHKIENEADSSKHNMTNYLLKDFLPPIEREDIIELAHRIDNITDFIDEILINMDILNIEILRPETLKMAQLLVEGCQKVTELLREFKVMKKFDIIKEKVIILNRLEERGDRLYEECMKELYRTSSDAINVIRWTTIFNCFENCFDSCESVADCVENIVMKNS